MVTPISNKALSQNVLRNIGNAKSKLASSVSRLTSGNRILKASDDATGLSISSRLNSDIRALQKGVENISQGISLTNVAEGGLQSISSILSEAKALAVQASTGTLSDNQRSAIQNQFNSLMSEVDRIVDGTEFNGNKLLDGTLSEDASELNIQVGTENNSSSKVNLNVIQDVGTESLGIKDLDISSQSSAQNAIGGIDSAIQNVVDVRGSIGSVQTRLTSVAGTQKNVIEQLTSASSEITDADFAKEISRLRESEVQLNASLQALQQSQFSSKNIGSLLNIRT
ncbi:MAG TPA: flagellin [Nitrospinota bacterium]|jgi:flagellin|nr:flagellin [Nitrospinota bacterium]